MGVGEYPLPECTIDPRRIWIRVWNDQPDNMEGSFERSRCNIEGSLRDLHLEVFVGVVKDPTLILISVVTVR